MITSTVLEYFRLIPKTKKPTYNKEFYHLANGVFKNASWLLYVTAILLIASCLYYFYLERSKRQVNLERLREMQHLIDRQPPKRRPGAVAREREVYRSVLETAHSYIYPKDNRNAYVIRQTRSGTIYGKFLNDKKMKEAEKGSL